MSTFFLILFSAILVKLRIRQTTMGHGFLHLKLPRYSAKRSLYAFVLMPKSSLSTFPMARREDVRLTYLHMKNEINLVQLFSIEKMCFNSTANEVRSSFTISVSELFEASYLVAPYK